MLPVPEQLRASQGPRVERNSYRDVSSCSDAPGILKRKSLPSQGCGDAFQEAVTSKLNPKDQEELTGVTPPEKTVLTKAQRLNILRNWRDRKSPGPRAVQ